MGAQGSTIQIQDDNSELKVSVVECTDDVTVNGVVVCNVDGSNI
jgi:hypothetical protein